MYIIHITQGGNNMKKNRTLLKLMMAFMLVFSGSTLVNTINEPQVHIVDAVIGEQGGGELDPSQAKLRAAVDQAVAGNSYTTDQGVTYRGSQLVKNGITTSLFEELSSSSKDQLIKDMNDAVNKKIKQDQETSTNNPVVEGTKKSWVDTMLKQPGVAGSTMAFLEGGLQADITSGKRILGPLYGPANVIAGVLIIAALLIIFVGFAIDLFAIIAPFMQTKVLASGGSGKSASSGMGMGGMQSGRSASKSGGGFIENSVSIEAISAINKAREDGKGTGAMISEYIKTRFIGVAAFTVMVVILVSGNVFTVIGLILDAISQIIPF